MSSNEDISITPITMTTVNVVDRIFIKRVEIKLKEYANIVFDLINNNNDYVGTRHLVMSGEDYANWGSDDDYIINWVKNNLNL